MVPSVYSTRGCWPSTGPANQTQGGGWSVSKKSNKIKPQGSHNRMLSDVNTAHSGLGWGKGASRGLTAIRLRLKLLSVAFLIVSATSAAAGETTIGRWCDRMIPGTPTYNRIMAIVIADNGKVVLQSQFRDGSSSTTRELREAAGSIYEKIGSTSGDKYRIIPSTGNLQLLDEDGLVRVAARLENTPSSRECSH